MNSHLGARARGGMFTESISSFFPFVLYIAILYDLIPYHTTMGYGIMMWYNWRVCMSLGTVQAVFSLERTASAVDGTGVHF